MLHDLKTNLGRLNRLSSIRLCVACPQAGVGSETFIENHLRHLPMTVCALYGASPRIDEHGRDIHRQGVFGRMTAWASKTIQGASWSQIRDRSLVRFYRQNEIDVVLAEYGPTGVKLMDSCTLAKIPLVVYFRGFDAYRQDVLEAHGEAYRQLFDRAAGLVAVSRPIKSQLIALGAPKEKISVIPSGVDTDRFVGADPAGAEPVFLAAGRFVEKKAPLNTLRSFAVVVRSIPEARLIMIGDGPLMSDAQALMGELNLGGDVQLMGARPHTKVLEEMKKARAFVQHSVVASDGDSEGTPNSVVEAQSCGLPVVATRHMGIPDVVRHDETGFLCDEHDIEGMAKHMAVLARDAPLAARLGKAGRARVLAGFSLSQSIHEVSALIEKIHVNNSKKLNVEQDV